MMNSFPPYRFEEWRKHGILCCGYEGCYSVAEAFMRKVVAFEFEDPEFEIMVDLEGKNFDISKASYTDFLNPKPWATTDAIERIYIRCVEHGEFFESFLKVCAETKLLDPWFLSERFMSNVWAGGIRGHWSILMTGEESKEPYRNRFRKFIKSLDDRGLKWTEKYLEPDRFWGDKKAYWLEEQ